MALDFQPATSVAYSTNAGHQAGPNWMLKVEPNQVITLTQTMLQAYVACFCRVDDLLSQWRAYGASDAAYSMRFSAARLNRQIQPWSLLAPVEYLGHNQVDRAHELIKTIRSALRQFDVQAKDITESNISFVASIVQFPFAIVVLLMKHPAFKEEKEWRLVYGPLFFDEKDRAKVLVKFRRGVAIPYVEIGSVGKDDQPRDIPVRGLRVGPHKDSAMAATGLEHLLTSLNRSDVSVASSTTPLR